MEVGDADALFRAGVEVPAGLVAVGCRHGGGVIAELIVWVVAEGVAEAEDVDAVHLGAVGSPEVELSGELHVTSLVAVIVEVVDLNGGRQAWYLELLAGAVLGAPHRVGVAGVYEGRRAELAVHQEPVVVGAGVQDCGGHAEDGGVHKLHVSGIEVVAGVDAGNPGVYAVSLRILLSPRAEGHILLHGVPLGGEDLRGNGDVLRGVNALSQVDCLLPGVEEGVAVQDGHLLLCWVADEVHAEHLGEAQDVLSRGILALEEQVLRDI